MTLMAGVLHADQPGKVLVDVRSALSPQQAARTLARSIAAASGGTVTAFFVFTSWTGIGFVIGVIIMAAIWAISLFKANDLQKWLAKSKFGLLEEKSDV
jgi:hypothetical protein